MTLISLLRIPATLEQHRLAEEKEPGLYAQIIELARSHGLRSHLRVYREGELMDIDEWESEEARAAFAKEAAPLLARIREARGSAPSAQSEVWYPIDEAP